MRSFSATSRAVVVMAVVLFLSQATASMAGPSILIGPYFQNPGPTSVTIQYITDLQTDGLIRYGEGRSMDKQVKSNLRGRTPGDEAWVYEARVTGLQPGKEYRYRVFPSGGSDAAASTVRKFRTFPDQARSVSFIVYSDTQTNPAAHKEVVSNFNRHDPAFILHAGDMTDKGTNFSLLPVFFGAVAGIVDHVPMMIAIGNHDGGSANLLRLFDLPGGRSYYSFECGPGHVVMLDAFQEGPDVLQWLEQDLAAATAPWKVAVYHTPTFNFGGHHSNDHRNTFLPLFVKYGVDVVFAGHSHVYERFKPMMADADAGRVITFITTGSAGGRLRPSIQDDVLAKAATLFDYIVVTASKGACRIESFDARGKPFDSLTISKKNGRVDNFYLAQAIPMNEAVRATEAPTKRSAAPPRPARSLRKAA